MITPIRILMVLAVLTLFMASGIHSGLLGLIDPFAPAALPEAIIAAVLMAGAVGALFRWPSSWPIAFGATLFAIIGTLVGMSITLPRGEPGDIVYHLALLGMLLVLSALLVQWRRWQA